MFDDWESRPPHGYGGRPHYEYHNCMMQQRYSGPEAQWICESTREEWPCADGEAHSCKQLASVLEDAGCFEAHHCRSIHAVRYCETCSTVSDRD
ncbi:hypothetical protein SeMB42_g07858 [Synchytrium endobioticum]|uniref:Uncharacterized protein n=1 Tax=Synchytrium endobioticum TaxID=286115 RepID=A0A507BUB9_9FUNG|nr:hypothetical protein SeMB42_g07858 [Synchytrium endobioticum]TPX36762.1 hypothetical protein SeLEV6574_g08017 [Synchytrium endobioticum]